MIIIQVLVGYVNCPLVDDNECRYLHAPIKTVEGFREDCPILNDDITITTNDILVKTDSSPDVSNEAKDNLDIQKN